MKGNLEKKLQPSLADFFSCLIFCKRSYASTNLTSLLFQRVILNKNSENQICTSRQRKLMSSLMQCVNVIAHRARIRNLILLRLNLEYQLQDNFTPIY